MPGKRELSKHSENKWVILALLALSFFMVVLDISIVNVALPSLSRELHFSPSNLQWVITAYSLTFGGFLLLGGRTADFFGRRRIFMTAVSFFSLASLMCGLAQSELWIIISRGVQGLAAAFMTPTALSIVLTEFQEGEERNKALGVWSAVSASGAAVGVLLGGVLTEYLGWRWNFFINVPVGIFVVLAAIRLLPHNLGEAKNKPKLDNFGALMATGGLMSLVFGLSRAPINGWGSGLVLGFLALSALLLGFFLWDESRSDHPMLPLRVFKNHNIAGGNLIALVLACGMFSSFFFMTLYVQTILGYSPIKAGVSFLIIPIVIAIAAGSASKLVSIVGHKPLLMVGPSLVAIGLFLNSHLIKVGGDYWHNFAPGMIVFGLGMGLSFVPLTLAATTGVAKNLSGLVSGVLNTSQQVGGAIGLAILSAIANSVTRHDISSGTATPQGRLHGFQIGFEVAVSFAVAAFLIATFVLKNKKALGRDATTSG